MLYVNWLHISRNTLICLVPGHLFRLIELANAEMSHDVEDTSTCPVFAGCEVCEHDSNDSNDAVEGSNTPPKNLRKLFVQYRKDWEKRFSMACAQKQRHIQGTLHYVP